MKERRQAENTDMYQLRVTALTFGCVFVLFPRLVGLFEAVVTYKAVVREEVNNKWLNLQVSISSVTISTKDSD